MALGGAVGRAGTPGAGSGTIWEAARCGDISFLRLCGVDERNDAGETALHIAARWGLDAVVQELVEGGANLELTDWESGWTALHRSLYFGHIRTSLLLLKAGANLNAPRDRSGATPMDLLSSCLKDYPEGSGVGGGVYSFGKADFQLGYLLNAADAHDPRPVDRLAGRRVVRVAAARWHTLACTDDGAVFAWGHGKGGRLGLGSNNVHIEPTPIPFFMGSRRAVVDVASAENHSLALTVDGSLFAWGFGSGLGMASKGGADTPKRVEGALKRERVVSIAAASNHSAATTASGLLFTWGRNDAGQLGRPGAGISSPAAVASPLLRGRHVICVAAAASSTVIIAQQSDVAPGAVLPVNEVYQFGYGSHALMRVNFQDPWPLKRSHCSWSHDARVNVVQVSAARSHNVARCSAGRVWVWGLGADNLGLEQSASRASACPPRLVSSMLPQSGGGVAAYVSASDSHTAVVTETGDLFTWGVADEGAGASLGHGHGLKYQPTPRRVSKLKGVVAVSSAPEHTVALLGQRRPSLPYSHAGCVAPPETEMGFNLGSAEEEDDETSTEHDQSNTTEGSPGTLKQHCERVLAAGIDFRNALCMLAYAISLDAMGLAEYASHFVRQNFDAVLILGRLADADLLLELETEAAAPFLTGRLAVDGALARHLVQDDLVSRPVEERGINRQAMEVALSRASALAEESSLALMSRTIRALRKKRSAIVQLEQQGGALTPDQLQKIARRDSIENELIALEPQYLALRERYEAASGRTRTESDGSISYLVVGRGHSSSIGSSIDSCNGLVLDCSPENRKQPIRCEACSLALSGPAAYAEHLLGRKHVKRVQQLERKLLDTAPERRSHGRGCSPRSLNFTLDLSPASSLEQRGRQGQQTRCEVCKLSCSGPTAYADHLRGRKHQKQVQKLEEDFRSPPEILEQPLLQAPKPDGGAKLFPKNGKKQDESVRKTALTLPLHDLIITGNSKQRGSANNLSKTPRSTKTWAPDAFGPSRTQSFQDILAEEEELRSERKQFAGNTSAWFVTQKPRSTSLGEIQEQQQREKAEAHELALATAEALDLERALELSRLEVERSPSRRRRGKTSKLRNTTRASY
jgi:alpha-tubulin suppressor-like RCC1 family protein